jgi:hypothetical protein
MTKKRFESKVKSAGKEARKREDRTQAKGSGCEERSEGPWR